MLGREYIRQRGETLCERLRQDGQTRRTHIEHGLPEVPISYRADD